MKCLKCGAELIGTEKFCYDCGSEVVKEEPAAVPNNVETATEVEIVTPVVEENVASQEVVTPVVTPNEETNVVPQPEVVESAMPVVEPVNNENPEVTATPVVEEETMADIMEGEPKKNNSKPLIIVALILLVIVILAGLFMTFKDYFIKDNKTKDPIAEQTQPEVEDKITTLMCNSTGNSQAKSTISITYNNGKAKYYDVKYTLDTAGLTNDEITSSKANLEQRVNEVSKFQGNAGFNYNYTKPTEETVTPTDGIQLETVFSLNYTVDVESIVNTQIYDLLQGMTGTQEEAKTTIQNIGYTCE